MTIKIKRHPPARIPLNSKICLYNIGYYRSIILACARNLIPVPNTVYYIRSLHLLNRSMCAVLINNTKKSSKQV